MTFSSLMVRKSLFSKTNFSANTEPRKSCLPFGSKKAFQSVYGEKSIYSIKMAFKDNPIIDQSARNSNNSERTLNNFLNLETGFICRPDVPDKGCDFDAELILSNKESSNWRFPIQLKSIEILTLIENEKYISYSLSN
jgi:hypothetical protein